MFRKILSVAVVLAMLVCMVPAAALAEGEGGIAVSFTVNDAGVLAAAKDGSAMAQKSVTVKDLNSDGSFTYDEALTALHDQYFEGGAAAGYNNGGGYVKMLWGVPSTNVLFFNNGRGLNTGVLADTVAEGDDLYASVNADDICWSDYYSCLDKKKVTVRPGEDVSLTLSGFSGMSGGEEVPLAGIELGSWENGGFVASGVTTDASGKGTLTFEETGEYVVTAGGAVDIPFDSPYSFYVLGRALNGKYLCGSIDWTTYASSLAYTEKDYGDGPYPLSEVKFTEYDMEINYPDDFEDGYPLYMKPGVAYDPNNPMAVVQMTGAPVMAPCCIVTVTDDYLKAAEEQVRALPEPEDVKLTDRDAVQAAKETYDALTDAEKEAFDPGLKKKLDDDLDRIAGLEQQVGDVEEAIDRIPEPVSREDAAAIEAARSAYDALPEASKPAVLNYDKLKKAEAALWGLTDGKQLDDIFKATEKHMEEVTEPKYGNEWSLLGLARDGRLTDARKKAYVTSLKEALDAGKGSLGRAVNYEKVLIALSAMGVDPTDIGGYDLLDYFSDFRKVQGPVNSTVFALIALDTRDYAIPEVAEGGVQNSREKMIGSILAARKPDGGWQPGSGEGFDIDMTAMALQALAPYYESRPEVKEAVDGAKELLRNALEKQQVESAESYAQIITALAELGEDPASAMMQQALRGLKMYYVPEGRFKHLLANELPDESLATPQAFYALVSYMRVLGGRTPLYDMRDEAAAVVKPAEPAEGSPQTGDVNGTWFWFAAMALCGAATVGVSRRIKEQ